MPLLEADQSLTLTSQMLYLNNRFDSETSVNGGGDGGNAGGLIPTGSASYVYKQSDDLSFGLTFGSYFGLGMDYGDDWEGRYYVTEAELLTMGINPAFGYRISERLLIGGGVNLLYSKLDQRAAINNFLDAVGDGELKLEDDTFGYGYNLGVMFLVNEDNAAGLSYRSQVDLEIEDALEFSNLGPVLGASIGNAKADLDLNVPQSILLGAHHDINENGL